MKSRLLLEKLLPELIIALKEIFNCDYDAFFKEP